MSQRTEFDARGVYVFVMTPFTTRHNQHGQYELDLAGLEQNITHFSKIPGEKTMVICGGSGEIASLSPQETVQVAAAAVSGAAGRCQVVCGVRGPDTLAARTASRLEAVGVDALLIMPHEPVVRKGDRALWERHQKIARSISIGMLPFRAPAQTLSIDLVKRFAAMPKVVAIKEESGAVDWVRTGKRVTGDTVPFITGGGENMVPYYYLAGAVGFTTGMANLTLPLSIRLHNAAIKGRMKQAMALRDEFETLTSLRQELGTPMVKAGLEMMGLAGGPVRSTGARLDATDRKRVRKMLKQKGIL
jgi:dihydrodipicolinate synthase/N-acetylneuraminate lyase